MSESNEDELAILELVPGLPAWAQRNDYWKRSLEPLRQHPGQWARVHGRAKWVGKVSQAINRRSWGRTPSGKVVPMILPDGIWRAATRGGELYVCFCGERTEASA